MSSSPERSSHPDESGPSASSSSPKPQTVETESLKFPEPRPTPYLGSSRQMVNSVFANVCPRLNLDEIHDLIFEEMLKLANRKEIPSSMLDEPKVMFTWDLLQNVCGKVLQARDAHLRAEYTKVLNLKLAEQHESLLKRTSEQLHDQFEDAGDPSYMV